MTETDAQTRRDIARAMLRMFEEVEGAAVDRMLSALRFAESNLPAESHPSAIREAVEGEREACAKIADKRADSSNKDCERLSFDGSTGTWECSLSHRSDCLCQEHQEEAEAIAAAIRARREEKGK